MSPYPLKPPPRRTHLPLSNKHLLAMHKLTLLLIFAVLQVHTLQAGAVVKGPSGRIPTIESGAASPPAPQGTAPPTAGGRAPESVPTEAPATTIAEQWMVEGHKAQKAGNQMEAVNDFLNAQRLAPNSPEPLYALGMSFFDWNG